jgi:hypothetical protein
MHVKDIYNIVIDNKHSLCEVPRLIHTGNYVHWRDTNDYVLMTVTSKTPVPT